MLVFIPIFNFILFQISTLILLGYVIFLHNNDFLVDHYIPICSLDELQFKHDNHYCFYDEKNYMYMINYGELSIEIHTSHTHEGILMKYSIVIH